MKSQDKKRNLVLDFVTSNEKIISFSNTEYLSVEVDRKEE